MLGRCDCYIQPRNARDKSSFKVWKVSDSDWSCVVGHENLVLSIWAFIPEMVFSLRGRRWLGDLNLQSIFFLFLSKLFLHDRMRAISSHQAPVPSWSMPLIFLEPWNQSILMWWVDPKLVKTWDIFKIRSCYIHQLDYCFGGIFFMGCCLCGVLLVRFLVGTFGKPWKSRNGPPNPKVFNRFWRRDVWCSNSVGFWWYSYSTSINN